MSQAHYDYYSFLPRTCRGVQTAGETARSGARGRCTLSGLTVGARARVVPHRWWCAAARGVGHADHLEQSTRGLLPARLYDFPRVILGKSSDQDWPASRCRLYDPHIWKQVGGTTESLAARCHLLLLLLLYLLATYLYASLLIAPSLHFILGHNEIFDWNIYLTAALSQDICTILPIISS